MALGEFYVKWNHNIQTRLLGVFLLIMIPIYIVSFGIYHWGLNTVRREMLNAMSSQAAFYLNNLEKEVRHMKALQLDLINDTDLGKLTLRTETISEFDKFGSVLRLHDRLKAIKNISTYINEVTVCMPTLNRSLSAVGGINPIETDRMNKLLNDVSMSESQIHYLDKKIYFSASPSFQAVPAKKVSFMIEIELSVEELQQGLRYFANDAYEGGAVLMNLDQDFLVYNDWMLQEQAFVGTLAENVWRQPEGVSTFKYGGDLYHIVHLHSEYLGMSLLRYTTEDQLFLDLRKYRNWFFAFTIASVIIVSLFSFVIHRWIHKPLAHIVRAFDRVKKGDLNFTVKYSVSDEFGYMYKRFNEMVEKLRTTIEQVYSQQLLTQRAELKQLQYQINPHFLYNSFFILHRLIKLNDPNSAVLSQQLGKYFRYITRNAADEVILEDEMEHARTYCDIQALRFNKRLNIEFQPLPEQYGKWMVPRLILQPLLENAIEHGLKDKEEEGLVKVTFAGLPGGVCIQVADNGNAMDDEQFAQLQGYLRAEDEHGEITGLLNIHRRLRLKFGEGSGLFLNRTEEGGLQVEVRIFADKDNMASEHKEL